MTNLGSPEDDQVASDFVIERGLVLNGRLDGLLTLFTEPYLVAQDLSPVVSILKGGRDSSYM